MTGDLRTTVGRQGYTHRNGSASPAWIVPKPYPARKPYSTRGRLPAYRVSQVKTSSSRNST